MLDTCQVYTLDKCHLNPLTGDEKVSAGDFDSIMSDKTRAIQLYKMSTSLFFAGLLR